MDKDDTFKQIVKKLIVLKETSELMIDLAYSSLLLNSVELADEVRMLEEKMDKLHTEFELLILSTGIKQEEAREYLGLMRIGSVTERLADAAEKMSGLVLRGLKPHPVMSLVIEEAEETVIRARVPKTSLLVGKTVGEAQIQEKTGMWILAIRRGNRWIRPESTTRIEADDVLIASGYAEGEEDFLRVVSGT
ncbi:MAG: TrkA C-terminal domain-containing protein [Candidatus Bathyarchaeia archaeon]